MHANGTHRARICERSTESHAATKSLVGLRDRMFERRTSDFVAACASIQSNPSRYTITSCFLQTLVNVLVW